MQPDRHSCGLIKFAEPASAQDRCGLRYIGNSDSCWPLAMRVVFFFLCGRRFAATQPAAPVIETQPQGQAQSQPRPQPKPAPAAI